jgi:hypothetical protein
MRTEGMFVEVNLVFIFTLLALVKGDGAKGGVGEGGETVRVKGAEVGTDMVGGSG